MKKYIVYIVYTSLLFIFGGCDVLDKYVLKLEIDINSKRISFQQRH